MRIAALSDFHIGSTERADGFRHRTGDFLRFLDRVESDHDVVVLLGDVFQTQHGWSHRETDRRRELHRSIERISRLWERLEGYRYVYGNHDAIAAVELGAVESLQFESDGLVVHLTHGHQFDPLLRRIRPVAETATWATGRLRAAGVGRIADALEHVDIALKHRRFRGPDGPYARGAASLLADRGADVVVMGHTHVATRVELDGGVYANTGSCSVGAFNYVSIDTAAGRVLSRSDGI